MSEPHSTSTSALEQDARIYEYSSAANPTMTPMPVRFLKAEQHQSGPTRVIPFDLSADLNLSFPASSPNLLSSFLRICAGESLETSAVATSQAFFVIRGAGNTKCGDLEVEWSAGDLFVLPAPVGSPATPCIHSASFSNADSSDIDLNNIVNAHQEQHASASSSESGDGSAALYWVNDSPLLSYLGVAPIASSSPSGNNDRKFQPTLFKRERLLAEVERIRHDSDAAHRNRMGILLGNKITADNTLTLTHTLWSLLNMIPPGDAQRPHRHNSVALDLCVFAPASGGVYTLMGPELDEQGWVKNPIKCDWRSGAVFTTPPGWWHSHHNDSEVAAWVLPMQDAGLYTHQRTLDIQFSK